MTVLFKITIDPAIQNNEIVKKATQQNQLTILLLDLKNTFFLMTHKKSMMVISVPWFFSFFFLSLNEQIVVFEKKANEKNTVVNLFDKVNEMNKIK